MMVTVAGAGAVLSYVCSHVFARTHAYSHLRVFICVLVCVSHPGSKGFSPPSPPFPPFPQAGGDRVTAWLSPTKLHAVDQDAGTDHPRVPALLTFAHAVQSFGLFSWCFMSSFP